MSHQIQDEAIANYEQFRDSLSLVIIGRLTRAPTNKTKRRVKSKTQPSPATPDNTSDTSNLATDAEELSEFIDYLATEIFTSLPADLQTLDHYTWSSDPSLQAQYPLPLTAETTTPFLITLDPSVTDSLLTYGITNSSPDITPTTSSEPPITPSDLLAPVLTAYLTTTTTPPPPPASTKGKVTACELCDRDWINLTYHHLIPRMVHAKVVKRGWHRADELQNVAWLCGACHRFVHHFAGHEELARRYYTVELLREQPEIEAWVAWVGRLRWKGLGTGRRRGV
ncbi:hypothetical protein B0T25DRAFT_613336 [Lasiosphaeria hispida]|uniref:HNH domain-containing protein n=1 Tax=Lasiosphaeria hispida TaxID=260671 RepID=A0AAJ0MB27_9PEZI|nr:hypothetical protein B0T25DRAFT_613336 [Lasiosphaeria hispida]